MPEVKIIGTGSYAPELIVSNDDLEKLVDTNDEWIYSRTGIRERRVATTETLESISAAAARIAMEDAGLKAEDLDMIIVATLTPDYPLPNASSALQKELGAAGATCFDLNAACTGFLFAMNTASMYIRCHEAKYILVIGAEILSKIVDWTDRSTCVLFGDGAGAAILAPSENQGFIGTVTGTDGTKGYTLTCGDTLTSGEQDNLNPFKPPVKSEDLISRYVYMDGPEVFKFAVKRVPECINQVLEKTGMTTGQVDHFVLHQANARIIESVAKRLKVPMDKFIINMDRYGNTSAASIPIALDELLKSQKVRPGDVLMIAGFGGGLTWGATLFRI